MEIVQELESQVGDILQMYDLAEKSYAYEHMRPKGNQHNEHLQRLNVADFQTNGPNSM